MSKDYSKYLPFLTGQYSTTPGIQKLDKAETEFDRLVFQIDDQYELYLENKKECRQESIHKYYHQSNYKPQTAKVINEYIINQLGSEHPAVYELKNDRFCNRKTGESFGYNLGTGVVDSDHYIDLFDALCNQVQEDMAVFQLTDESDYLTAVHLCAPNHWSPGAKIGKPFDAIHQPVADMEETIKRYPPMLQSIVKLGSPFTRFAWGIATDIRLNHHPEAPEGVDKKEWEGRSSASDEDPIFIRVERQNLIGFPEVNAFLFTIRTYHYTVDELTTSEKKQLWEAVKSMSPATLNYKGLNEILPELVRRLK